MRKTSTFRKLMSVRSSGRSLTLVSSSSKSSGFRQSKLLLLWSHRKNRFSSAM